MQKNIKIISTHLLARLGWFCPVASEPVKPYFTRFLRVLTFCLGASKIVILKENGVVNGVVNGGGEILGLGKIRSRESIGNDKIVYIRGTKLWQIESLN